VFTTGYLRLRGYLSRLHIGRRLIALRLAPVRNFLTGLERWLLRSVPSDTRLRHEFNRWAQNGSGERMERDHMWFTEIAASRMGLSSADRILDLGCGEGWGCGLMAARLSDLDLVVGLDISDEMVRRARKKIGQFEKVVFLCGSAEHIPCRDQAFTKVLSVEAFYWFAHPETVLRELFRVVAPEGQLFILVCLYKERPNWLLYTANGLVHVCSAEEYKCMLRAAGWIDVHTEEWVQKCEPGRKPGGHTRALLITARRPCHKSALLDERYNRSENDFDRSRALPVPQSPVQVTDRISIASKELP
jgi:SAM-dependent methyltransferase